MTTSGVVFIKHLRINGKTASLHLVPMLLVSIKNQIVQQLLCNSNLMISMVTIVFSSKMVSLVLVELDVSTEITTINLP